MSTACNLDHLRIGIVVGEASGDILGAALIKSILAIYPNTQFEGIGGPLMLEQGFDSLFEMDRLSVMGFVEPLKRLPELLAMRKKLKQHFIQQPPDLFLGIDSPDFNLNLELALREKGVLTAHYVSPSVWAWRQGRVNKIAKAVDHMLTLFPFEAEFYQQHNVPVTFVGHSLADQFPVEKTVIEQLSLDARHSLGLAADDTVIALLPGSRGGEVKMLGQAFIETARWCVEQSNNSLNLKFLIPAASHARKLQLEQLLKTFGQDLPIVLIDGQSQLVMTAADVVLMASGTTTLEAMLLKKPMVVAYRLAWLSYAILSRLVKSPFISLPNLLAGREMVPEILQDNVRPEVLGGLILERLEKNNSYQALIDCFTDIHQQLKLGASDRAAQVLLTMITDKAKRL
jgi:lipid-A-disaccharide synthase